MRPTSDVEEVFRLANVGMSHAAVARASGVSRAQVRQWLRVGREATLASPMRARSVDHDEHGCPHLDDVPGEAYAYLLGQYLGDGCISRIGRVWRLRVVCCDDYPGIMDEVEAAMAAVLPNVVGRAPKQGCTEVYSSSLHWPCLFPQHGSGRKHERPIVLERWQEDLVLDRYPGVLLRGLIHSDGWRGTNGVTVRGRRYSYPRYLFTNESYDIRLIFTEACDRLGVACRPNNRNSISVARRRSVALLDEYVGPKY